jgi:hypothetical protein
MMRNNQLRTVVAICCSIAAILAVVCVLSATDNEAARQEVLFPTVGNVAMARPMDSMATERAASVALNRDVSSFLLRRARTMPHAAAVMRKRMAQAKAQHALAPMEQLVATTSMKKEGYYKDPAFRYGNTLVHGAKDWLFNKKRPDPAMDESIPTETISMGTLVANDIMDRMTNAATLPTIKAKSQYEDDDEYVPAATKGGLHWSDVRSIIKESDKNMGTLAPSVRVRRAPPSNAKANYVTKEGDITGTNPDYSKASFGKISLPPPAPRTFSRSASSPNLGSTSSRKPSMMRTLVKDGMAAPNPKLPVPGRVPNIAVGSYTRPDPAFAFTPKKTDPVFPNPRQPDPAFATARKPSPTLAQQPPANTAIKTAVQLAKKAMAEHAKKTAPSTKIEQLRAATAHKELKYKKAMAAMVSKTTNDIKH